VKGYFPGHLTFVKNPSIRGLQAVSRHAAKTGNKDKICFVKSFLPNI